MATAYGHAILPVAAKQPARAEQAEQEADQRPGMEAGQQGGVETGRQVEGGDGPEQQAGNGELLGEAGDRVDLPVGEKARPRRGIARADQ